MNAMTTITTTGRITLDPELQYSKNGNAYIQFSVAVNKGYGEKQHTNFFQCVLYGTDAERLVNAKVKKGSLLSIAGDLDLVDFTRKDGTKSMSPKITVYNWSYAPTIKPKSEESTSVENTTNNSDSDAYDVGFEQITCGEEGLPFN